MVLRKKFKLVIYKQFLISTEVCFNGLESVTLKYHHALTSHHEHDQDQDCSQFLGPGYKLLVGGGEKVCRWLETVAVTRSSRYAADYVVPPDFAPIPH